jgi:hypothetical protein
MSDHLTRPGPQPFNAGITPGLAGPAAPADTQPLATLTARVEDIVTWIEGEAAEKFDKLAAALLLLDKLEQRIAELETTIERLTIATENL